MSLAPSDLPLTDFRSRASHVAEDCPLERCDYCGCCVHGHTNRDGCKVDRAPRGMGCPQAYCGCRGKS